MSTFWQFLNRYWSLLGAFLIVVLEIYVRGIPFERVGFQNPTRVVWIICLICTAVTALCLGLIVHSWQMQRRFTRNKWRLVFWTHVLLFPALTTIVLGLREIQVSTYDLSVEREQFQNLHWYTADLKDFLIWLVPLDVILIVPWAIMAVFKNKSGGSDSRPT
ncbi:MAG: hypothetical protein ABR956_03170 [Terracidiphilus sp.]|jgi:hypothetical protein